MSIYIEAGNYDPPYDEHSFCKKMLNRKVIPRAIIAVEYLEKPGEYLVGYDNIKDTFRGFPTANLRRTIDEKKIPRITLGKRYGLDERDIIDVEFLNLISEVSPEYEYELDSEYYPGIKHELYIPFAAGTVATLDSIPYNRSLAAFKPEELLRKFEMRFRHNEFMHRIHADLINHIA